MMAFGSSVKKSFLHPIDENNKIISADMLNIFFIIILLVFVTGLSLRQVHIPFAMANHIDLSFQDRALCTL